FFILLYIQSPLQATLQALDLARPAMWNSLVGAAIKLTVLFLLASNSNFGINGVAIAMSVGVILVTLLHLASHYKEIGFMIAVGDLLKISKFVSMTMLCGRFLRGIFNGLNTNLFVFALILIALLNIYVILLFILRYLTKEELRQIPILQKWM